MVRLKAMAEKPSVQVVVLSGLHAIDRVSVLRSLLRVWETVRGWVTVRVHVRVWVTVRLG